MEKFKLNKTAKRVVSEALRLMRKYPHHYNQSLGRRPDLRRKPDALSGCGSVGCIAGFIHSAAARLGVDHPAPVAAYVGSFNTTGALCDSSVSLDEVRNFYHLDLWPIEYKRAYNQSFSDRQRTAVAIRRMRHWMKTGL